SFLLGRRLANGPLRKESTFSSTSAGLGCASPVNACMSRSTTMSAVTAPKGLVPVAICLSRAVRDGASAESLDPLDPESRERLSEENNLASLRRRPSGANEELLRVHEHLDVLIKHRRRLCLDASVQRPRWILEHACDRHSLFDEIEHMS